MFDSFADRGMIFRAIDYTASCTICVIGVCMGVNFGSLALGTATVLDAVIFAGTQIYLDAISFLFLMYGFVFVFLHTHCHFTDIREKLLMSIYLDHVGSTFWVLLVYTIEGFSTATFKFDDWIWTLLEGLCVFHAPFAMRGSSVHISLWPVTSLLQLLFVLPHLTRLLEMTQKTAGKTTTLVGLCVCSVLIVVSAAVYGSVYKILITSFPLRLLEFLTGGAFVAVDVMKPQHQNNHIVIYNAVFILTWLHTLTLTSLVAPSSTPTDKSCLQISQPFPCMPVWSVAISRGTIAGVMMLALFIIPERATASSDEEVQAQSAIQKCELHMQRIHTLTTSVVYAWPIAISVRMILRTFFTVDLLGRLGIFLMGSIFPAAMILFLRMHTSNKPRIIQFVSASLSYGTQRFKSKAFHQIPEEVSPVDSERAETQ